MRTSLGLVKPALTCHDDISVFKSFTLATFHNGHVFSMPQPPPIATRAIQCRRNARLIVDFDGAGLSLSAVR